MLNYRYMKTSLRKQTVGYILAAFGFVAGLAWNDAIKGLIDFAFPLGTESLIPKFIYAILATVIVVVVSALLIRWSGEDKS